MSEEKPMTIKDRMAALARASSGGNSVPTPAPLKSSAAPSGTSVAERLAKMRGSSPGAGGGGIGQSPSGSPGPKKMPLSRSSTPPSAPTIDTKSPGTPSGGSRVADRIAMMSGGASPSHPQSPFKGSAGSASPGVSRTASAGSEADGAASGKPSADRRTFAPPPTQPPSDVTQTVLQTRVQVMNVKSCSAGGGEEASATSSPSSTKSPRAPGKLSAGLAARMKAINLESPAGGGGEGGEVAAAAKEEQEPPPPPAPASSGPGTSPRVSPGLAARLQALGAGPGCPPGESSNPGRGGGGGDEPGNGMGRAQRMGGVGLPGMGMGIPMPGAMPPGGLAELKRRKQEAERAASGGGEAVDSSTSAAEPAAEQKPGELQHANLSRATMPQRRRPRKAARPFKATASAASPPQAVTEVAPPTASTLPPAATSPTAATSPATKAASRATRTFPEKEIEDAGAPAVTSPAVKAASPAKTTFPEKEAEDTVAPSEPACALPDAGSGRTMDAMLRAASARIAGETDDEDDAEWD